MTFTKATRAGTKALIGLYGESGSGKTFSALMLARGLAGLDGLVLMIDTENRRGEMYADEIPGGYEVAQMNEPFSSQKYSQMIGEAENAAGNQPAALVIDSFSHEWEGIGGVVNAAETISENRAKKYNSEWNGTVQFGDWKQPKQDHKRMMLQMLGSNLHIICCLRAQYASHQVEKKDFEKYGIKSNAKTAVIRDDFQTPIQDKNFIYEMTVNAELSNKRPGVPILRKCPKMLLPSFQITDRISVETGAAVAEWTAGGAPATQEIADLWQGADDAVARGTEAYKDWFSEQKPDRQKLIVDDGKHETNKMNARKVDEANDFPGDR